MKKIRFTHTFIPTFIGCFLLLSAAATAQTPFSPALDSMICRGIDQTIMCRFDSALATFSRVRDARPGHSAGYFYLAATIQSRMMDYERNDSADDFYRLIDKAISLGEDSASSEDTGAWHLFYLGSSYMYKGMFQVKTGSMLAGFISAKKGTAMLRRAVEQDSALWDAFLGIGNYAYWSGRFYKYLKWLPWISDQREQGLAMLNTAVEKATFSRWIAINSLAWVEYDRGNYFKALSMFRQGERRYPKSRFFTWGIADCLFRLNDYKSALFAYEELLKDVQENTPNWGYNEAEILKKMLLSCFGLKLYEQCEKHAQAILSLKCPPDVQKRIKKHRIIAEEYLVRCRSIRNARARE